jgi:hypothetical protein
MRARWIATAVMLLLSGLGCVSSEVSREVGARCEAKAECDERCLSADDGYPGGFCSLSCADDLDCPSGARCVDTEGGVCLFECVDDSTCALLGEGWRCQPRPAAASGDEVLVCRGR